MEFLQLRTLKAYRLLGSRSHTTVLGPYTLSVALHTPLSSPSSWDGDWPSLGSEVRAPSPPSCLSSPRVAPPQPWHPPAVLQDVVVGWQVVLGQPPADRGLVVDSAAGEVNERRVWNWREEQREGGLV